MKIEEFCTQLKILSLIFIFFVSFLLLPTLAYPKSQLTVCDIRPYSYSVAFGDRFSGNLNSVYEDDSDTLNIRANWFWWGAYYEFYIDVYFSFEHIKCDELYFDFVSLNTAQESTVTIWVYYTDGTWDGTSQKPSGFHTVALDNSKEIDKVLVQLIDRNYIISGGDRYLLVDLIAAKPVGDNTPPNINIEYKDGDLTDASPGKWDVYAYESESSIDQNAIKVWVDNQLVGTELGEYEVPSSLGQHNIYVEVENIIGCPTSISQSVQIIDDDDLLPVISYIYTGDGTDKNPGEIVISATDESGLFVDPSGIYPIPNIPGTYGFTFSATDNDNDRVSDRSTKSISISINLVDDDDTPPEIEIQYFGNSNDGDPGYFEWRVSDMDSGISEINITVFYESTEGLDNYTLHFDGNETGYWNLPSDLGIYTMEVSARDNDNDRIDDSLTRTTIFSNFVIDDDDTPPEVDILYIGSGFDNNPGYFKWNISDIDSEINDINITISYESTEGLDDFSIPLIGIEAGTWNLLPNIGLYTIEISVRDNDDDRSLIVDSLTTEVMREQNIIDDDIDPPELSNLILVPDIFEVNVTFNAIDLSGVGDISIFVNGELIEPIAQVQYESTYSFIFENHWFFERTETEVVIYVKDCDYDRPEDSLTSFISGSFKNVMYKMYEYVIWQIEQLKQYISENLYNCTARYLNCKLTRSQDLLYKAFSYTDNGNITCGLFYDAMAKVMVQIAEFKVDFLNTYGCIPDDQAEHIISSLHEIRNNIVILMGTSTGSEQGVEIAYIEVDLLNLRDLIEEEIEWGDGLCLFYFLKSAIYTLEATIFKISMNIDINRILSCTLWKLDIAVCLTKCILEEGKITQEVADILLDRITQAQTDIEVVQNSL